jgi:hypothetical protein
MMLIIKLTILTYILSDMLSIFFELKPYVKFRPIQFLMTKLYCWKCLSFWVSLAYTGDIFIAATVSLISIIIETIINKINQW